MTQSEYYFPHYQSPPPRPKTNRGWWVLVLTVAVLVGIGLLTVILITSGSDKPAASVGVTQTEFTMSSLETAQRDCPNSGAELSEAEGSDTLSFRGVFEPEGIACVLVELGTPVRVIDHIDATRALDGMQTDEWDGPKNSYSARWTYHPDDGINLTVWETR